MTSSTDDLARMLDALRTMAPAGSDAERIDRVRLLEELKSVAAAVQLDEAVVFADSQRAGQAAAGVPADRQGRGVAAQLALARRVSPWSAARWLGFGRILHDELPATHAELRAGRTTEWRATLVARETAMLSREHRGIVDAELAPRLAGYGDLRVEREARTMAYRLDPEASVARARRAEADRHVSVRPAPDTMCRLSMLAPLAQGVGAYAALRQHAEGLRTAGDPRSIGQIMADTLVERVTGQAAAADVPVEIMLVMSDETLTGDSDESAALLGTGLGAEPIPAGLARDLALSTDTPAPRWLRRLFQRPQSGDLITMESRRRTFTPAQRHYLLARDRTCRTPFCDAPIRHADHVLTYADGGPTALTNAQGYCETCNHAKQAPGWQTRAAPDPTSGTITVRTPTGHTYRSRPPNPPGRRRPMIVEHSHLRLHYEPLPHAS